MRRGEQATLGKHARFRHSTEEAHAGYYAVTLEPYDIRVELTATPHMGIQQYTFQKSLGLSLRNPRSTPCYELGSDHR